MAYQQPFNPMNQYQLNNMIQQRDLLNAQINSMNQQYSTQQFNPQPQYDFVGKWIDDESQTTNMINQFSGQPIAMFEKNTNRFHMSNNGVIETYEYNRVDKRSPSNDENSRLEALEEKFDQLVLYFKKEGLIEDGKQLVQHDAKSKSGKPAK